MINLALSCSLALAILAGSAPAERDGPPAYYMGHYAATLLAQAEQQPLDSRAVATPEELPAPSREADGAVPDDGPANAPEALPLPTSEDELAPPKEGPQTGDADGEQARGTMSEATVELRDGELWFTSGSRAQAAPNVAEIRKADAEVRLAEAVHNKVCQDVARDVALAYERYKSAQKGKLDAAAGADAGLIPYSQRGEQASLAAALEAELRNLLGISVPTQKGDKLEFAPIPERLEDMIALALRENASIKEAAAKVNVERLNRESVRSRVMHDSALAASRVKTLEERLADMQARVAAGVASRDELLKLRAELDYALQEANAQNASETRSKVSDFDASATRRQQLQNTHWKPTDAPREVTELEKALDMPLSVEFADTPLQEVLDFLADSTNVSFVVDIEVDTGATRTLRIEDKSLRETLLALADQIEGTCFVIRDYGILVTTTDRAWTMNSPTIPEIIR